MRVIIRYARIDKAGELKPFEDFRYEAEFDLNGDKKEDKKELKKVLTAVMNNYGDCYLDHYLEKKADVFACYYEDDSKPFFVSENAKKADPLAVIDGFIARFRVKKVILTNGNITHTLSSPKRNSSKSSRYKDTIKVSKINTIYKNTVVEGKNIIISFPYRDGGFSDMPNIPCVDNLVPFLYMIKGMVSSSTEPDEDGFSTSTTVNFEFHMLRWFRYGKKIIYILVGKSKMIEDIYISGGDSRIITDTEGLFYSNLYLWKIENLSTELINLIPWKIKIQTDYGDEALNEYNYSKTIDTKLMLMAKRREYIEIDSLRSMLRVRENIIDEELKRYGLDFLTEEQTKELLHLFVKENNSLLIDVIRVEDIHNTIKQCKSEIRKYNSSAKTDDDFDKLMDSIEHSVSETKQKYLNNNDSERRKRKTTIHELGHAFMGNLLVENGGFWRKITVIPVPELGYSGCCFSNDIDDEMLPNPADCMKVCFGGRAAEKLIIGVEDSGWGQDYYDSKRYVIDMLEKTSTSFSYDKNKKKIMVQIQGYEPMDADDILDEMVGLMFERTIELLRPEKKNILKLTPILIEKGTITGKEFDEMFEKRNGK